jgi:uncharacterized protein DUF6883
MKLPNADNAVTDIKKLRDYSLSLEHPVGVHKARVFRASLGKNANDAEWLREEILKSSRQSEAKSGSVSPFGDVYIVDAKLSRDKLSAIVRTIWIIEFGKELLRLVTCYVK